MRASAAATVLIILTCLAGITASVAETSGPILTGRTAELWSAADVDGVTGLIVFFDTGNSENGLIVRGEVSGLDPSKTYVSLIYNFGSAARGSFACEPTNSTLDDDQMFVGFWKVGPSGKGELFAVKMGQGYTSLLDVGTAAIREVQGPAPAGFTLHTCSRVDIEGGGRKPSALRRSPNSGLTVEQDDTQDSRLRRSLAP